MKNVERTHGQTWPENLQVNLGILGLSRILPEVDRTLHILRIVRNYNHAFFRFMTGATQYRIEAANREEAIRIAFEDLQPNEDTKAVILRTLYDEEEGKSFHEPKPQPSAARSRSHLRLAD